MTTDRLGPPRYTPDTGAGFVDAASLLIIDDPIAPPRMAPRSGTLQKIEHAARLLSGLGQDLSDEIASLGREVDILRTTVAEQERDRLALLTQLGRLTAERDAARVALHDALELAVPERSETIRALTAERDAARQSGGSAEVAWQVLYSATSAALTTAQAAIDAGASDEVALDRIMAELEMGRAPRPAGGTP